MELVKIVIVGHVDHGKSTLIGRLLYDTQSVPKDRIEDVKAKCKRLGKEFEFAFLLDAFEEEQEQTITIDTTQIFFKSGKRDYYIIDAPGHKEFLKNMVTGASNADTAILLIDANEGIKEQTKRHIYILHLLGMRDIIVAVNKMDLIGYSEGQFERLKEQIGILLSKMDVNPRYIVPLSAKMGDNISAKSRNMAWYGGPTLLESLDNFLVPPGISLPLRLPVQDIYRWDERIIAGRVESGMIRAGAEITFYPSLKTTKVTSIKKWGKNQRDALEGECIGMTTEDQLFVERGEIAALASAPPTVTQEFRANVFWMGSKPLLITGRYKLKLLTSETPCEVVLIKERINSSTLEVIQENASELRNAEVGKLVIRTETPIAADTFKDLKKSGRFVIVDGFDVAGGGIITDVLGNVDDPETS